MAKKIAKKKVAKKTATAAATAEKKPLTKSEIYAHMAEATGMAKKDVGVFFDELGVLIGKNLGRRGPGIFSLPGLAKIKVIRKPATKARKGINPFTKEEQVFAAKPARNVVKVTPLKNLKDMV